MTPTIAERLAQFSDRLQFDDIPPEVIDKTKRLVLDTLGVCIGSTRLDFGVSALDMVAGWGGAAEATAIGGCGKVPAQNAALCNGILGHGQDYDDTHTESVVHPSAALVPAALALAERQHASGRDMLTALVAGLETSIRIAMPALNKFHLRGMHTTSVATTFGAAMMAAKLQKLGLQKTIEAVGIGGSFASGLLECIPAAAGAKRLHAGWGAFCGIMSAQFAQGGFTGPATIFEGKLGVYNSFLRGEDYDLDVIFKGIGRRWETLDVRPKLYPCCHYLQAFLDCAAALRKKHSLRPDDITDISCRIAQGAVNIVCEPWAKKLDPRTGYDARFSLAFAVARNARERQGWRRGILREELWRSRDPPVDGQGALRGRTPLRSEGHAGVGGDHIARWRQARVGSAGGARQYATSDCTRGTAGKISCQHRVYRPRGGIPHRGRRACPRRGGQCRRLHGATGGAGACGECRMNPLHDAWCRRHDGRRAQVLERAAYARVD